MTELNLKSLKPYPVEKLTEERGFVEGTVCWLLRDIYRRTGDEGCLLAIRMAKNMMLALVDYRQMLMENGFGIWRDRIHRWQYRPKPLYRGRNYRRSKKYEIEKGEER